MGVSTKYCEVKVWRGVGVAVVGCRCGVCRRDAWGEGVCVGCMGSCY